MRIVSLLAALSLSAAASATEVVRLSAAERDAVLDAAANGPERQPVLTPIQPERQSMLGRSLYPEFYGEGGGVRDRKVHGEVTMFAGSGSTFGMAGTAVMPVGDTGTAAISVMRGTSNWGGLQGFSLGYASGGAPLGLGGYGGIGGFGGGYGGFGGPLMYGSPFGYGQIGGQMGGPPRRRR
jgi:hypothetical protein